MYSINGTYINNKNKIYEHMADITGIPIIDKEAIAEESDRRGTTVRGGSNINYSENTGGITRTTTTEKVVDISEESQSTNELIDVVDIEKSTTIKEETKFERKATLEESLFKSKSSRDFDPTDMFKVKLCKDCDFEKCDLKLLTGEYNDLSELGVDVYGNNGISSFRVPPDFKLIVYSKANFKGKSWTIHGPQNVACLIHLGWDNKIASCRVVNEKDIATISTKCGFLGKSTEFYPGEYENQLRIGLFKGDIEVKKEEGYTITVATDAQGSPDAKSNNWAGKYEQARDSEGKLRWKNGRPMYINDGAILRYELANEFAGKHILGGKSGWAMGKDSHHRVAIVDSSNNMYPPLNINWVFRTWPFNYVQGSYFKISSKEIPKVLPKVIESFTEVEDIEYPSTFIVYSLDGSIGWSDDGMNFNLTDDNGEWKYGKRVPFRKILFNGSIWLGVGTESGPNNTSKNLSYSYDGKNWYFVYESAMNYKTSCIGWDGTKWIAGGPNGLITSKDGFLWDKIDNITSNIKDVATNGSNWVCVGSLGFSGIAWSNDGLEWTNVENNIFNYGGKFIKFNGSYWVAYGNSSSSYRGSIAYSENGKDWEKYDDVFKNNSEYQFVLSDISWNGKIWIAVGLATRNEPNMYFSEDGINWTAIEEKPLAEANSICWNGKIWIVVGSNSVSVGGIYGNNIPDGNYAAYSEDGITWTGIKNKNNNYPKIYFIQSVSIPSYIKNVKKESVKIDYPDTYMVATVSGLKDTVGWSNDGKVWRFTDRKFISSPSSFEDHMPGFAVEFNGSIWLTTGLAELMGTSGGSAVYHNRHVIGYSNDGKNWKGIKNIPGITTGRCISWNGSKWIVGGNGGLITSNDGLNWTALSDETNKLFGTVMGISNNKSIWVCTGYNEINSLGWSSDGVTWNGLGNKVLKVATGVKFNGSYWLALGGRGTNNYAISEDGKNWTGGVIPNMSFLDTYSGSNLAWNGTMWIIVGQSSKRNYWEKKDSNMFYSYDGKQWIGISQIPLVSPHTINWNGKLWLVSSIYHSDRGKFIYSEDGFNWTTVDKISDDLVSSSNQYRILSFGTVYNKSFINGDSNNFNDVDSQIKTQIVKKSSYNPYMVIAVQGKSQSIGWSEDGKTWRFTDYKSSYNEWVPTVAVAYNESMWLSAGNGAGRKISYSTDGKTWTGISNVPLISCGMCISWNTFDWIVGGYGGMVTSKDGLKWSEVPYSANLFRNVFGIANNGSMWVCTGSGSNNLGWSEDGIKWYGLGKLLDGMGQTVQYNGSYWLATSSGIKNIAYSEDGKNWTLGSIPNFEFNWWSGLAWNGEKWIGVGSSRRYIPNMYYSYDGLTWEPISQIAIDRCTSICWNGKIWVVSGYTYTKGNTIAYSEDGINWTGLGNSVSSDIPGGGSGIQILNLASMNVLPNTEGGVIEEEPPKINYNFEEIASIKIGSNLKMTIYEDDFFEGESKEFEGPLTINCLDSLGWGDRIKSFKLHSKFETNKTINNKNLSNDDWLKLFNESPNKLIKRECQDCNIEHKTIVYKRLTPLEEISSGSSFVNDENILNNLQNLKNYYAERWNNIYSMVLVYKIWRCSGSNKKFSGWMNYRYKHKNGHQGDVGAPISYNNGNWYGFKTGLAKFDSNPPGGCVKLYDSTITEVSKNNINLKDLFLNNWTSKGNILNKDFELYNGDPRDVKDVIPSGDGKIQNVSGSYGKNCGKSADRTSWLGDMCKDKSYCEFKADNSMGDPAPGCVKNLDYSYSCSANGTTYRTSNGSAEEYYINNQIGAMDCRESTNKGPASKPEVFTDSASSIKRWSYCNYDDSEIGFPRDCGLIRKIDNQWNSLTKPSAIKKFRYSIETKDGKWITLYQSRDFVVPDNDTNVLSVLNVEKTDEEKAEMAIFKQLIYKDPNNEFYNGLNLLIDCQDGIVCKIELSEYESKDLIVEPKSAKEFVLMDTTNDENVRYLAEFIDDGLKLKIIKEDDDSEWILDKINIGGLSDFSHPKCGLDWLNILYNGYVYSNVEEYSFKSDSLPLIIDVNEKMKLDNDYTISFWFYPSSIKGNTPYLFYYNKDRIDNSNSGLIIGYNFDELNEKYVINVKTNNNDMSHIIEEFINKWTHIAVTFKKNGFVKLYIDGILAKEGVESNTKPIGDYNFIFGKNVDGEMKNMAILNEVLTDNYIKEFAKSHRRNVSTIINPDGSLSQYNEEESYKITDISALPVPGETLWHYVKDKKPDENKFLWSGRIYNCMRGQQGCGTNFIDEGGSRHNALMFLGDDESFATGCTLQTDNEYSYKPFGGDISNLSHILIEVNATNDAYIALGEDTDHNGTHYEIVLGGWDNSKSTIRDKNQGNNLVEYISKIFGSDLVQGLKYEYFDVVNINGTFDSTPFKTEILNGPVNYWWSDQTVLNSGKSDKIGIKITGYIKIPSNGEWQFRVKTDDGFRMKISDNYVINSWKRQAPTYRESTPSFLGTGIYKLEIEWFEWTGYATMPLEWKNTGSYTPIPPTALFIYGSKPQKFWIAWDYGELRVGKEHVVNEKEFMKIDMTDYNYQIKNMMVSTGWGATGIWKLYNGLCGKDKLSKAMADRLCNNPCYWYGKEGRGNERNSFIDSNMCDCSKGDDPFGCNEKDDKCAKAINFDIGPTILPAFQESRSSSTFKSKEYSEKMKLLEKNESKRTQSYSLTSESIILDPDTPIIPGKGKKNTSMPSYFSNDELKNSKNLADKKLKLEGDENNLNNLIMEVPEGPFYVEEENVEPKEIKNTIDVEISTPVPPPPPPPTPLPPPLTKDTRKRRKRRNPREKNDKDIDNNETKDEEEEDEEGSGIGLSILLIIFAIILILFFIFRK